MTSVPHGINCDQIERAGENMTPRVFRFIAAILAVAFMMLAVPYAVFANIRGMDSDLRWYLSGVTTGLIGGAGIAFLSCYPELNPPKQFSLRALLLTMTWVAVVAGLVSAIFHWRK
jgi:NhaP-type Na+/H+ or K+/H+ antiporter